MQRQSVSGVQFVNQTMDMLTIDWARVSIWAMTMASPSVSSSTASSWSAETVSEIDGEHNVENIMLCSSAHHACSPLLQGNVQEEDLCKVSLTC